ncbi:isoleucyl-tRNA synthetase [Daldinia decipiens]|uniref:isoleucyl-tRNA synthetase n=1 Tax=Daldinia decipiens TaxID=326647 RepID=UPI0020C33D43|nr:isoleucyl-tRNA synthetase [Daldinia decipiens]KAI1652670.1 isoleucyl-tRNA synthetase [Daldinia decipiens]
MQKSWSTTLRLPNSKFPPRPLPKLRELYIQRCADGLYEWQRLNRPPDNTFVIHDGPPYANGDLHVGHALNKILKDMILRVKIQQGRRVEYTPGWDCHGLPIELKALEKSQGSELGPVEVRKSARNLASNTVLKQMKSFRSYGVMGDWDQRWTTMDATFEIRQLRLFQQIVKKGLIYRRFKPVYWSPSSGTALAEAELEYRDDHISHAAWVRFPITEDWKTLSQFESVRDNVAGQLYAVIWTTTPWTLPANRAIAVEDKLEYCIVRYGNDALLVAKSRLDTLASKIGAKDVKVLGTFEGAQLTTLKYINRLRGKDAPLQPLIHADFVSADSGSGLVHLAPGHGFDDYDVCRKLDIDVAAPIDDQGRFTSDAFPDSPELLQSAPSVNEGGGRNVLDLLKPHGDVLRVERHQHKYPYDWRTKKPVIIRATEQWFADVGSIKQEALAALGNVRFIPESGRKRLESFVQGRSEWCISRQRAWGVPIPSLYDETGSAVMNEEVVEHVISVIHQRGTQAWWSDAPDDEIWIPSSLKGKGKYRRGTDTMDVWFDSGSSWTMMPGRADVYLEGSDQHRGWFQSSLLTRIAAGTQVDTNFEKGAPFKQLITHGFTLDQAGKKMSKSLGNIIEPQQVMDGTLLPPIKRKKGNTAPQGQPAYDAMGPDALRLWVASSDYTHDVTIGTPVLSAIHTMLIKYRTIIKMLLGSVHKSSRTSPLTAIDHIAILQLQDTMQDVGNAFDNYEFYKGFAVLNKWVTNDLSAFYLESLKDRLYCGDGGGVIESLLTGLLRMLTPVTPLLVEEAWDHRPDWMKEDSSLTHPLHQLYSNPVIEPTRLTRDLTTLRKDIPVLMSVHTAVKSTLEAARSDKVLGSSLQSNVFVEVPDIQTQKVLESYADELESMFVVSSVAVNTKPPSKIEWTYTREFEVGGIKGAVVVLPPKHAKCPRCWRYLSPKEDSLCGRCEDVVAG